LWFVLVHYATRSPSQDKITEGEKEYYLSDAIDLAASDDSEMSHANLLGHTLWEADQKGRKRGTNEDQTFDQGHPSEPVSISRMNLFDS